MKGRKQTGDTGSDGRVTDAWSDTAAGLDWGLL